MFQIWSVSKMRTKTEKISHKLAWGWWPTVRVHGLQLRQVKKLNYELGNNRESGQTVADDDSACKLKIMLAALWAGLTAM